MRLLRVVLVGLLALVASGAPAPGEEKKPAAAEIEVARAELVKSEANLKLAQVELERALALVDKGGIAVAELDAMKARLEVARADVAARRARLAALRGDDKKADGVLQMKGYLVPARQIRLTPPVAGQLSEVLVKEGDVVEKGQILARIDPRPFEANVKRAEAALAGARARLAELEAGPRREEVNAAEADLKAGQAQLEAARERQKRMEELATKARAVSSEELCEAQRAAEVQTAVVAKLKAALALVKEGAPKERLDAAKAAVAEAEARLARARWELDGATVKAPIAGTVLQLQADVGGFVSPTATVASWLCDLADLSQLEVEVAVQERDLGHIARGQKCLIRPDAFPKEELTGTVTRIGPVADRAKGAMPMRVRLGPLDKDSKLRPEMGAIVTFQEKK
jgi:HlyD family secretion protein